MSIPFLGRTAQHSTGRGALHALGEDAVFSELSSTYPLKLLSPKINSKIPVGVAYILSYGGGLISDDLINLSFDIGENAILLLLTQVGQIALRNHLSCLTRVYAGVHKSLQNPNPEPRSGK